MNVLELKRALSALLDDYKVVLDVSRDYEEYDEVKGIHVGTFTHGFAGNCFKGSSGLKDFQQDFNAVLLR